MKILQRLVIALCVAALPIYAVADYTATQGAGTTVFAFVCFVSKVCPTHTNVTSTGTEIFTLAVPGQVTLSASNVGITGTVAATQSGNWSFQPGNVTITNTTGTPVFISGQNLAQESNGNLAAILAAVNAAIPAGTNPIGFVTSTNIAQASGGWTMITMTNLLSTANAIKASAGQLAKIYCYNPNASVAYLQVFNTASGSVTAGTTKPAQFYGIPATNAAGFAMSPVGDQYSIAISAAATTTATGATAPGSGLDCSFSFN